LTFKQSFTLFNPKPFPLTGSPGIIAPFWSDIDLRNWNNGADVGHLYYQCYNRTDQGAAPLTTNQRSVFDEVTTRVHANLNDSSFKPSLLCVVSWVKVHAFVVVLNENKVCFIKFEFFLLFLDY